jgi:endonuclease/exonuclease/phosphatase family metal-dependent hydrolase
MMRLGRTLVSLVFGWTVTTVASAALTIATYNVENYCVTDRMVEGVFRPAYPKPEGEKAAVRQVIAALAADLLALQEMGSPPFLDELQRDLRREGQEFPHAVVLEAADAERHVAVLSKVPFKEVRRHAAVPIVPPGRSDVVKRGVLEVTLVTGAGEVTLFVVHLKSRRTERPDDPDGATQRLREAEAVRELVLRRFPEPGAARFMILGDFNDTRASKPVETLLRRGRREIGELLRAVDSRGEAWTYHFRRQDTYDRTDMMLVSAGLKPLVEDGGARIYDGPAVRQASDHRPVVVRLTTDYAK